MQERVWKSISEIHHGDIHQIIAWFGEDVEPAVNDYLGRGFKFTFPSSWENSSIEMYKQRSTLHFISKEDRVEMENVSCPAINNQSIIFSGFDKDSVQRYLAISKDGEVVYYRGPQGPHADTKVHAFNMPVPPTLEAIVELIRKTSKKGGSTLDKFSLGEVIEDDEETIEPGQELPPFTVPRKMPASFPN